jgi:hypothetical protein
MLKNKQNNNMEMNMVDLAAMKNMRKVKNVNTDELLFDIRK